MSADFCPNTPDDIRQMLEKIGVGGVDDLFANIPGELRAKSFDLPEGMSEFELRERMTELAQANSGNLVHFIGGGAYDHFIPAVVDHLANRAEFYTAYTPYQPECSQGTLQALYEYQTAVCMLTGMEVSNASMYDGATAFAEGAMMAARVTGRSKIVLDGSVNPFYRQVVKTYLDNVDVEIVEVPAAADLSPATADFPLDGEVAAVLVQNPNFFGTVSDFTELAARVHEAGALLVMSVYPISLGIVKSPADMGADIVTGDGQSLGIPVSFGGPSFGFITAKKAYVRNMPGRIIGETIDKQGRRGFVLTLQAREQHIKRHKATSNICSNQSLCALRGLIFLMSVGREGLVEMATLNRDKAEYAKARLAAVKGVAVANGGPTFNEFTVSLPGSAAVAVEKLLAKGVAAGLPAGSWFEGRDNLLIITVTEKRTKEEIDALASALEELSWN